MGKEARKERNKIDGHLRSINQRKNNIEYECDNINRKLENWTNETKRKEAHIFGSHRHEFEGEVFGPIVQEMTVKHDQFATFLNSVIGQSVFYGYVCQNGKDWERLLQELRRFNLRV